MSGKLLGVILVSLGLIAGVAVYYLQVYAFYDEVSGEDISVRLTPLASETSETILAENVEGIDSNSSPLRYRACFTTRMSQAMLTETYEPYDAAVPLVAPGWFDCFDATEIGQALEDGRALAFLSEREVARGVDRVVAVFEDGRGFAWHQLNGTLEERGTE